MADLARRFPENPLLRPSDVAPSREGMRVECVLNPGVFRLEGRTHLVVRIAERPELEPGMVRIPFLRDGQLRILSAQANDPDLDTSDPREYRYRGEGYLSTMSHLRVFDSPDGRSFAEAELPRLWGWGDHEGFGIEDCRVATMKDGRFLLTFTAVSHNGYGVGLRVTRDWQSFHDYGIILPPANKDAAIFEEQINGFYLCLNRPSGVVVGGHYIWMAASPDLRHWGAHRCVARTRPGKWDSARIGAGAAPIRTEHGWLEIYHGSNGERYCLGALLLDSSEPWKVIARSSQPIMEPLAAYEQQGFFGNVVFTNGHLTDGDSIILYYGASDRVICGATMSIREILQSF